MKYVSLRVPDDLHAELTEWAARDQRSLHGQILWALQQALAADRQEPRRSVASLHKKYSAAPNDPERLTPDQKPFDMPGPAS
jgi:hypothetical protein